jgi:predicted nucleic acid-binding protein
MDALDTNIWLYAYDRRDPAKQNAVVDLLERIPSLALLWQVGCEFVAGARKLGHLGFTQEQAWEALVRMTDAADAVLLPDVEVWSSARNLQNRLSLHYWDALIVAGCLRGNVQTLYSEDFSHGMEIDGLRIVNPFVSR